MAQSPATLRRAAPADAGAIAVMVKALTDEIVARTGAPHFNIDLPLTAARCRAFIEADAYAVYIAGAAARQPVGFAALCECRALYAEGVFGIVQEFYVAPECRSAGIGRALLAAALEHGRQAAWTRLELCTPPLPEFDRTLGFYEAHGFEVTGGRKMKRLLP